MAVMLEVFILSVGECSLLETLQCKFGGIRIDWRRAGLFFVSEKKVVYDVLSGSNEWMLLVMNVFEQQQRRA